MKAKNKKRGNEALRELRLMLRGGKLAIPHHEMARILKGAKHAEAGHNGRLKNDK